MRSLFRTPFQPARLSGVSDGRPAASLGDMLFAQERNSLLSKIESGSQKLLAVKKWIASRIDADPMLLRTFGQQHISDNFWGYDELVDKDQYYVNVALDTLRDDLESWDLDGETLSRIDEWAAAIDIMYGAMNQYGKTPLTTVTGAVIPGTVAPPASAAPAGVTGGGQIPAGSDVTTRPPSVGLSTKEILTYGGIGAGALVVIAALKKFL